MSERPSRKKATAYDKDTENGSIVNMLTSNVQGDSSRNQVTNQTNQGTSVSTGSIQDQNHADLVKTKNLGPKYQQPPPILNQQVQDDTNELESQDGEHVHYAVVDVWFICKLKENCWETRNLNRIA
ncbi:uncharacterized protein MELLADRAFT_66498 [Melampsora larici-populina 98AG31]|uniref:Uncharacterized protein n=1 Tax=Melampsora larici-populina (strain 98AG31 / pathotype 3-4-7) TaxID=747676 RepID=F4RZF6_MELLP|nr:uncharacterized protein MELLADRAFT_66498 [Melampsora larici-populina 98AG31]EGG02218.1 hypothetical protein MELLADRAFT_66498 [Melampsora larici-populina 98AG31]